MQVAFLDYVRYLIGAMWSSTTPASFEAKKACINQGMHKRDASHQLHMIHKAVDLVEGRLSVLRPFNSTEQSMWDQLPPVLRICATAVHVADHAGSIIRCYYGACASPSLFRCELNHNIV